MIITLPQWLFVSRVQNQWVMAWFDLVSVTLIGTIRLSLSHAVDWPTLPLLQSDIHKWKQLRTRDRIAQSVSFGSDNPKVRSGRDHRYLIESRSYLLILCSTCILDIKKTILAGLWPQILGTCPKWIIKINTKIKT